MIGLWIDGLTNEQRDRIVTALSWGFGCGTRYDARGNHGPDDLYTGNCLVDHALGQAGAYYAESGRYPIGRSPNYRYDCLCHRFGKARVVRAIKLRAGASLPPMATEREAPQATEVAR